MSVTEEILVHEFACLCACNMAKDFSSKPLLETTDVLQPLVALLSAQDPDVQKNSAECLALLLQDDAAVPLIRSVDSKQGFIYFFGLCSALINILYSKVLYRTLLDKKIQR